MSVDRCLRCGNEIVEGIQVCYECNTILPVEEMTKEELTREIMKLTGVMISVECRLVEITSMFIDLMKKVTVMK